MTIRAEDVRAIASAFESRWVQGYVRGKLTRDSIYGAVAEELRGTTHPLLDIGCGLGLLSHYLGAEGISAKSFGIDHDFRKITAAQRSAKLKSLGARFAVGDARAPLRFRGNVLLLDLLHYFSDHDQRSILGAAAEATASGGLLIIRDCLRDSSWRYRITVMQERFSKSIGWLRGDVLNFPTREMIEHELRSAGLVMNEIRPLWSKTPFNNYLMLFRRPSGL